MDHRWIVRAACCASTLVCACLLAGCGSESPTPGDPESRDGLVEAPLYEPNSTQSPAAPYQPGVNRLGDDQAADRESGLLIPPSNRRTTAFSGGDEPPLPDSVMSLARSASDELRLPVEQRRQPSPGSDDAPLPENLDAAGVSRWAQGLEPSSVDTPAMAGAAEAEEATARHPLKFRVSESKFNEPAPSSSTPRGDRWSSSADVRPLVNDVDIARDEPQPTPRLTIPVAEPVMATPPTGAMKLRPVPDAMAATPEVGRDTVAAVQKIVPEVIRAHPNKISADAAVGEADSRQKHGLKDD